MSFMITGDPRVIKEIITTTLAPEKTFKWGKETVTIALVTKEPTKVTNKLTGESVILPPDQVDLYDLMVGIEMMLDGRGPWPQGMSPEQNAKFKRDQVQQFRTIRYWFRDNNYTAYQKLID